MLKATIGGVAPYSRRTNAIPRADLVAHVMITLDREADTITAFPCSRHVPAGLIDALAEAMAGYADDTFTGARA